MIYGIYLALLEILLFSGIAFILRIIYNNLQTIKVIPYYWIMFTILTGFWETSFILNYKNSTKLSKELILNNKHVWSNKYDLTNLDPFKFSILFYSEYGGYADREYMVLTNDWSRVIESSHALLCGLFALLSILCKINNNTDNYLICLAISMGSQLMNSILYLINYFIQCNTYNNINFNNSTFPAGQFLNKRPFMYINIFWTIMPLYIIIIILNNKNKNKKKSFKI